MHRRTCGLFVATATRPWGRYLTSMISSLKPTITRCWSMEGAKASQKCRLWSLVMAITHGRGKLNDTGGQNAYELRAH